MWFQLVSSNYVCTTNREHFFIYLQVSSQKIQWIFKSTAFMQNKRCFEEYADHPSLCICPTYSEFDNDLWFYMQTCTVNTKLIQKDALRMWNAATSQQFFVSQLLYCCWFCYCSPLWVPSSNCWQQGFPKGSTTCASLFCVQNRTKSFLNTNDSAWNLKQSKMKMIWYVSPSKQEMEEVMFTLFLGPALSIWSLTVQWQNLSSKAASGVAAYSTIVLCSHRTINHTCKQHHDHCTISKAVAAQTARKIR